MDNNCNNLSDEDVTETFFVDSDEDGYGDVSGNCYSIFKSVSSSLVGDSWSNSTLDIVRDDVILQTISYENGDSFEEYICLGGEDDVELYWNRINPHRILLESYQSP